MSDKIEISFDDEKEKGEEPGKIIIDFGDEVTEPETVEIKAEAEEEIKDDPGIAELKQDEKPEEPAGDIKINSYYRASPSLGNCFPGTLKFPEGIERGFRKRFIINLKDEFFNSMVENNECLILSSKNGNIYFIDKKTGKVKNRVSLFPETFEKTGLVYENSLYINSLTGIHLAEGNGTDAPPKKVYSSGAGFFIWSNLNRYENFIPFLEYNPAGKTAFLKIMNTESCNIAYEYEFAVREYIHDSICIAGNYLYFSYDSRVYKLVMPGFDSLLAESFEGADENCILFSAGNRLFITNRDNDIYYSDFNSTMPDFKFTGIKESYINSAAGFDDNVFTGTIDGWKYFKSNGMPVYTHEDADENHIRALNANILVVSKKNRLIFHNLKRFQEAEGFTLTIEGENRPQEILTAVISNNDIFALTEEGILASFTNDRLNIHI
jgi:hypothetical protein